MSFKPFHPNQSLLLPPSFADFLGQSHEAVILSEFMAELDTATLENSYHNTHGGSSAYHPAMLLSVLVYAYMNSIFSSRQIARKLGQDLAFMYLAGNQTPDFRTLSRFRKDKGTMLKDVFVQVISKAKALGLVSFGACSLDGTKIYANASKDKNTSTTRQITDLLNQAEEVDTQEDKLYGEQTDSMPEQLKTKAGRQQKKREQKTKQGRVNTTDPDSKLMQMKRKDYAQAYNAQVITENGFVLSNSIFNSSADQGTLRASLEQFKALHAKAPEKLLADKGYSSEDNYFFCEQNKIDAYIPIYNPGTDLSGYTYHPATDTYADKQGRIYRFKQRMEKKDGSSKRGRPKKSTVLMAQKKLHQQYKRIVYLYQNTKTKAKKFLQVSPGWQKYMKQQAKKLSTREGRLLYRKRMHDVEGVFANIKHNLNFTRFKLRGFQGVATEWNLISLAHNLKKLI